jgi:mannan endo-1,4-beta-mannosidase
MTIPPPQPAGPRSRPSRHARREPTGTRGITRIVQTSDLPEGINALASADSKTIIVRAGLDKATRRQAIRQVLAATHRFPALALYPALADARIRRFLGEAADTASAFLQHAGGFLSANPATAALAPLATVAPVGAATVGVVTVVAPSRPPSSPATGRTAGAGTSRPTQLKVTLPRLADSYLGVYEHSSPETYAGVDQFAAAIGHQPNIAVYYSGWYESFRTAFAMQAAASHAIPLVQMDPSGVSLASIAAGRSDKYLTAFAQAVHAYGGGVIICFGHEMNANWYSWGYGHTRPGAFVAAWRHVVTLFRSQGDGNVTWLWTVNVSAPQAGPVAPWWPGPGFVTWVGIDGYFLTGADTFASVFGPTLSEVSGISGDPILISETAAPPGNVQASQIATLFSGIKDHQILGFVWFDVDQSGGLNHQDWRLEGDRPALAEFGRESAHYRW